MDMHTIRVSWEILVSISVAIISTIGFIIELTRRYLFLEKRISLLEQELDTLPTQDHIHRLDIKMTRIEGDITHLINTTNKTDQSLNYVTRYITSSLNDDSLQ